MELIERRAATEVVDEEQALLALGALSHPIRLKIFRALVVVGDPGLTPSAITEALQLPPATLSFHLKELTTSGLVSQQRSGRNFIYRAAYGRMNGLLGYLTLNCCKGETCLPTLNQPDCGC